jgi:hypothetical protein
MGLYMRYIVADERRVTMADLKEGFHSGGSAYHFDETAAEMTVFHKGRRIAEVSIDDLVHDPLDEELEELLEDVEHSRGCGKPAVLDMLHAARQIVVVQVLYGTAGLEETIKRIDPLWDWLLAHYRGLVQAGEGYYDGVGLLLPLE